MLRRFLPFVSVAALLVASVASGDAARERSPQPSVAYRVRTDPALARMTVQVCFEGAPPPSLGPGIERAGRALLDAHDAVGRPLPTSNGRIDTSGLAPDTCLAYRIDLEAARRSSRFARRFGVDFVSSQGAWLWRDRRRPPTGGATIRFDLPPGIRAATPWPRTGETQHLDASAFQRPAFVAFGRLEPIVVERAGVRVEAVRLGDGWALDDDGVRRWLTTAIDGIATVQGRFPVDHLSVVMAPSDGRGIDFGMVRRGGGFSVAFVTGRRSSAEDLERAWVTWHELSHLQLPALPQRDAWLYEGLATYYQEVVAARAGVQPPEQAWDEILDGFERGARSRGRRPLAREAEMMGQTRAYMRVYWAGTAFALDADVRLRQRGRSLDAAIARGARTWRNSTRVWTSEELCGVWDRPLDRAVLRPLRDRYAARVGFPGTDSLLRRLGVRRDGGAVDLREAELSTVRDSIMRP